MKLTAKNKDKGIILGSTQSRAPFLKKPEVLTEGELNHHVHIVGASGFGKTVMLSHIVKQTIEQGRGLLFIDLKGDIETVLKFSEFAFKSNRGEDLQIFSLSNKKLSIPYNPIASGTATQLKDKIMSALTWSEEYYKHQSASALLYLLIGLCFLRDELHNTFTLGGVLKCLKSVGAVEDLFIKVSAFNTPEAKRVSDIVADCVEFLKQKENFSSLQGLRSQIEALVLSDFGEMISSHSQGIDLFESINQNKVTYMFLDSRRYSESSKVMGKFILQDLKAVSARIDAEVRKEQRKPFVCIIDEFADLAQEDFIGFLDRARSSKISIVVAHQEISDLLRISPEFAGRLMGNTSTLYAFLQKNPESAEIISGMAGTRSVWKTTYQTDRMLFLEVVSGKGSKREVEEFNIHPNLIKSLGVGECVVVKKYPKARAYLLNVFPDGK